ncbi:MAG: hypothetical protein ACC669_06930 [bacterium]
MVERIKHKDQLLAIIVSARFSKPGVHFFTEDHLSQQLAFMRHKEGKVINPHIHNPVPRDVKYTQEVLFIRRGILKVNFYSNEKEYIENRVLEAGDTVLLVSGGHGFEVIEEVEMIEVKQGPYTGDEDKVHFDPE